MNLDRLSQPLDKNRVKTRAAGGNRPALSYLESHDVIRTANDIFGFGHWGHEVQELRCIGSVTVHNNEQKAGTHVGYVCVVRLNVTTEYTDGTFVAAVTTSGVGYGDATEYRESAAVTAHELAAKEAESDALKRALKNYGDAFGLALYSKTAATDGHLTSGSGASATGSSAASQNTITEPQQKRLWAKAKEHEVGGDAVKAIIQSVAGVESTAAIPREKYDQVIEAIESESLPF